MNHIQAKHQSTEVHAYGLAYPVTALGPGKRIALWMAGCSLGCPGCITPQLWDRSTGESTKAEELADRILNTPADIEGITLTGGEPFEQAEPLSVLTEILVEARPHWSVVVYSGYSLAALERRGEPARALLGFTDVLVAGAYRDDRPPNHALAGSGNQRVHFLTPRGEALRTVISALSPNQANLGLSLSGENAWLIGVMDAKARAAIRTALNHRGIPDGDNA